MMTCDIIREEKGAALSIHNGDIAVVENARFEDVRLEDLTGKFVDLHVGLSIYSEDCPYEYSRKNPKRKPAGDGPWLKLAAEALNTHAKYRGGIRKIHFKNIRISGPQLPPSLIRGYGPGHSVQDVSFEHVTCQGQPVLDAKQAGLVLEHAENVRFSP